MFEKLAERILEAAAISGEVVRPPDEKEPRVWTERIAGLVPTLKEPQFIISQDVEPIVAAGDFILLGRVDEAHRDLWILTDPDLLANHGLHEGQNASIAVKAIQRIRGGGGSVVIDEEMHGYGTAHSVWRALLTFPLVLVTLHAALASVPHPAAWLR